VFFRDGSLRSAFERHPQIRLAPKKPLSGSDTPSIDPAPQVAKVVFARISDEDKRKILGGDAERLLGP